MNRILDKIKKHNISELPALVYKNLSYKLADLKYPFYSGLPYGYAPNPKSINIKLTNRCNLNCVMCGQTKLRQTQWQKEELSPGQWVEFIRKIAHIKPFISLWGGEPLLYEGVIDIIAESQKNGIKVGIITNGTMLEALAQNLAEFDNIELGISLDGPAQTHDKIRNKPGVFEKLKTGFDKIQYHRLKLGKPKLNVSLIFSTLTPDNQYQIPQLIDTARYFSPHQLFISYQTFIFPGMDKATNILMQKELNASYPGLDAFVADLSKLNIAHIEKLTQTMNNGGFAKDFHVQFNPKLHPSEIKSYYCDPKFTMGRKTCFRPWFIAEILPNGQMNFCPDYTGYRFGDITKDDFLKIWNGADARKFRMLLKQKKLFPMCYRCCGLLTHQPNAVLRQ